MFPVPSYASKTFHDEVGRWFDAVGEVLAPRLWPAGPIVLLQVDNEASYYFRDAAYDQDYHPDALALWRKYLEKRYGTLAKVAEAHRREYARWDDCEPPERFRAESSEELALHLDWGAFREDLITQSLAKMKRRLSKAGLKGAVTVHNFPLGDQGVPMSSTAIEGVVDLSHQIVGDRQAHRVRLGCSGFPCAFDVVVDGGQRLRLGGPVTLGRQLCQPPGKVAGVGSLHVVLRGRGQFVPVVDRVLCGGACGPIDQRRLGKPLTENRGDARHLDAVGVLVAVPAAVVSSYEWRLECCHALVLS